MRLQARLTIRKPSEHGRDKVKIFGIRQALLVTLPGVTFCHFKVGKNEHFESVKIEFKNDSNFEINFLIKFAPNLCLYVLKNKREALCFDAFEFFKPYFKYDFFASLTTKVTSFFIIILRIIKVEPNMVKNNKGSLLEEATLTLDPFYHQIRVNI